MAKDDADAAQLAAYFQAVLLVAAGMPEVCQAVRLSAVSLPGTQRMLPPFLVGSPPATMLPGRLATWLQAFAEQATEAAMEHGFLEERVDDSPHP